MKHLKTMMVTALATLTCASTSVAFAANVSGAEAAKPTEIVAERIDVSLGEAMKDASFNLQLYLEGEAVSEKMDAIVPYNDSGFWYCWGESEPDGWTGNSKPVGYSEFVRYYTVQPTYHYTRTFLGSEWSPRGDSGRVWGNYTVKAVGTGCLQDVWDSYVHRVFYGT